MSISEKENISKVPEISNVKNIAGRDKIVSPGKTETERSCKGRGEPTKKRPRPSDPVDLSIMNLSAAFTSHLTKKTNENLANADEAFGILITNELKMMTDPERKSQKKRNIMKIIYD